MADIERTIEIIFGAVDNTGSVLSTIGGSISGIADSVSAVTTPLANFADDALAAEGAIVGLGIAAAGFAVNEAGDFNQAIGEIGSLFNATPDDVEKLGKAITDFATDTPFSLADINSAMYDLVSATGDVEGSLESLTTVGNLAITGNTDLSVAVDAVTTAANSYGIELDKADSIADAFFVTVQNGKTTLPDLASNIGTVATTAAASKVPLDDILAAVAALTGAGVSTPTAMTQLNALLSEMAAPSDELARALGDVTLEADGLDGVMAALEKATGGSFNEMSNLFGSIEATKGALVLANDSSGTFNKTLDAMETKAGTVATNVETMSDNLSTLNTNLSLAIVAIGQELDPAWDEIEGGLSDIFKGVTVSVDEGAFDPVFTALGKFSEALGEYLSGIGEALPDALDGVDFSGLIESFGGLGDSIGGLFGDLDLTDADDLRDAIQFVVDSVGSLTTVVSGIVEAWGPALSTVGDFIAGFNDLDTDTQRLAGNVGGYSQQFELLKDAILLGAGAFETIGIAISAIATGSALSSLSTAFTSLSTIFPGLATAATGLGTALGTAGLVASAGAAGYAVGTVLADGIDAVIQKTTGQEGASLGTWIHDLFNSGDENTTAPALNKVKEGLEDIEGTDTKGIAENLDSVFKVGEAGGAKSEAVYDLLKSLKDLDAIEAEKISSKLSLILDSKDSDTDKEQAIVALKDSISDVGDKAEEAAPKARDFDAEVEKVADSSTSMADVMADAKKELAEIGIEFDDSAYNAKAADSEYQKIVKSLTDVDRVWADARQNGTSFNAQMELNKEAAAVAADETSYLADELRKAEEAGAEYYIAMRDGVPHVISLADETKNAAAEVDRAEEEVGKLTEAQRLAIEETGKMERELASLASNEKIKAMEFSVDLQIAGIQANAQIAVASFDSIGVAIDALSRDSASLWGEFADNGGWSGSRELEEAALRQEERLDRELEMQQGLIDAEIENLSAQTQALQEGMSPININADNLAPELQQVLRSLIDNIRVEALNNGLEILL